MKYTYLLRKTIAIALLSIVLSACSSTKNIGSDEFQKSNTRAETIVSALPDYSSTLSTLQGKGRAIVSEPGNTDRVTVYFSSTQNKSLVTVKNSVGIEGGELLTDGDTLLIYNKIDKVARRVPIGEGNLSRINNLASMNILSLINIPVEAKHVREVLENKNRYRLRLESGAQLVVDKKSHTILSIQQPQSSNLPYSRILYDAYSQIDGFMLPRKITIFSADANSRVNFMIQSLDVNPEIEEPSITLPDNITIYSR